MTAQWFCGGNGGVQWSASGGVFGGNLPATNTNRGHGVVRQLSKLVNTSHQNVITTLYG